MNLLLKILFWDTPKINENSAQTIFRILGNILRSAISIIVILSTASALIIYVIDARSPLNRYRNSIYAEVIPNGAVDGFEDCAASNDVAILITNRTNRRITNIRVKIDARPENFSFSALSHFRNTRTIQAIFDPGSSWRLCTNFAIDVGYEKNDLIWSAEVQYFEVWNE